VPFLVILLAIACAALEAHGHRCATAARGIEDIAAAASSVALTDPDFPTSEAFTQENGPTLGPIEVSTATAQRHSSRSHGTELTGPADSRSPGAVASRARMAAITYLDFALQLALARFGHVAYRSVIPPPVYA
jgi:hypothetical protein